MSTDPLSFFAGSDSSGSESEDEADATSSPVPPAAPANTDKLPSPDTLFATVGRPSFLNNSTERYINWDSFVKNDAEPLEAHVHLREGGGNYAAIAPPTELNDESSSTNKRRVHSSLTAAIVNTYSNTGGEISAPPVRYATNDVDPKFRTVSDDTEGSPEVHSTTGKHNSAGLSEDGSSKRQKLETFRQKEKRKRDSGQTSRGKSYVEEEKRVLRQHFGTDEVMS